MRRSKHRPEIQVASWQKVETLAIMEFMRWIALIASNSVKESALAVQTGTA